MAEAEVKEEVEQEEVQQEEQQYTEAEQKAMERGWDPSFEGDENKPAKTAEQFLQDQWIYDEFRRHNREKADLRKEIESLRNNDKKVAQRMYELAKRDLMAEKKAAYEEGDTDKVLAADEKIRELDKDQESYNNQPEKDTNTEVQAVFQDWVRQNPWYENDPDLAAYADGVGPRVVQENPHLADNNGKVVNYDEFLRKVSERTKRAHPDKFKGKPRRNPVEGDSASTGATSKSKKYSIRSLDEDERQIAKRVIETTGMKEEDYMKFYLGES